jgi:hypothetical protein
VDAPVLNGHSAKPAVYGSSEGASTPAAEEPPAEGWKERSAAAGTDAVLLNGHNSAAAQHRSSNGLPNGLHCAHCTSMPGACSCSTPSPARGVPAAGEHGRQPEEAPAQSPSPPSAPFWKGSAQAGITFAGAASSPPARGGGAYSGATSPPRAHAHTDPIRAELHDGALAAGRAAGPMGHTSDVHPSAVFERSPEPAESGGRAHTSDVRPSAVGGSAEPPPAESGSSSALPSAAGGPAAEPVASSAGLQQGPAEAQDSGAEHAAGEERRGASDSGAGIAAGPQHRRGSAERGILRRSLQASVQREAVKGYLIHRWAGVCWVGGCCAYSGPELVDKACRMHACRRSAPWLGRGACGLARVPFFPISRLFTYNSISWARAGRRRC